MTTHSGFEEPFLEFFENVNVGDSSACALAMHSHQRVVVEDITDSDIFAGEPSLEILLDAGVRAVQSVPLMSSTGNTSRNHFHALQRASSTERTRVALDGSVGPSNG